MVGLVTRCRSCGGRLGVTMADLGLQPPLNAFVTSLAAAHEEQRYPLRAKVCESCKLVQLDYDVAPQELFGNYVYFSSYSDHWLVHARQYCEMARRRFGHLVSDRVGEILFLAILCRASPGSGTQVLGRDLALCPALVLRNA